MSTMRLLYHRWRSSYGGDEESHEVPIFMQQLYRAVAEHVLLSELGEKEETRVNSQDCELTSRARSFRPKCSAATTPRLMTGVEVSSWSHQDVSTLLAEAGVSHQNEEIVEFGYSVDILLLPHNFSAFGLDVCSVLRECKAIVIEFDGPSHFENYLGRPLGPTVAKHRHLRCLGYVVASITYNEYVMKRMTKEEKWEVIVKAIRRGADSFKR